MDFFFGSGTSIQSGIPTGSGLVWDFKKEIYCSETGTSRESGTIRIWKIKDILLVKEGNSI